MTPVYTARSPLRWTSDYQTVNGSQSLLTDPGDKKYTRTAPLGPVDEPAEGWFLFYFYWYRIRCKLIRQMLSQDGR